MHSWCVLNKFSMIWRGIDDRWTFLLHLHVSNDLRGRNEKRQPATSVRLPEYRPAVFRGDSSRRYDVHCLVWKRAHHRKSHGHFIHSNRVVESETSLTSISTRWQPSAVGRSDSHLPNRIVLRREKLNLKMSAVDRLHYCLILMSVQKSYIQ